MAKKAKAKIQTVFDAERDNNGKGVKAKRILKMLKKL